LGPARPGSSANIGEPCEMKRVGSDDIKNHMAAQCEKRKVQT
jgi:hypothetical protein